MPNITVPKELSELTKLDFQRYEEIRKRGRFNMFMPEAKLASGLDGATYSGVMKNYTELMKLYPEVRQDAN